MPTYTVTSTPASLTFTSGNTGNWRINQTATVKLPSAPTSDVTIYFSRRYAEFTPSSLTFTTTNWNTPQSVTVNMKSDPGADPTVDLSSVPANYRVPRRNQRAKVYNFQIRALDDVSPGNASGWVPSALLPAKPTGLTATPGDANVTLAWDDPANPTINNYQYQEGSGAWKDAAVGVTLGASTLTFTPTITATLGAFSLTFTTQDWNTYQTVTVKLASQPPAGTTTVTFNATAWSSRPPL